VIRTGLEPVARSLEGCCSIQLSYRTKMSMFDFAAAKVVKLRYKASFLFYCQKKKAVKTAFYEYL